MTTSFCNEKQPGLVLGYILCKWQVSKLMYISVTNVSHSDRYNISMAVISWKLGVSTSGVYGPGTVSEFTVGQYSASHWTVLDVTFFLPGNQIRNKIVDRWSISKRVKQINLIGSHLVLIQWATERQIEVKIKAQPWP